MSQGSDDPVVADVSVDDSDEGWSESTPDEDDLAFWVEQRPPHHG